MDQPLFLQNWDCLFSISYLFRIRFLKRCTNTYLFYLDLILLLIKLVLWFVAASQAVVVLHIQLLQVMLLYCGKVELNNLFSLKIQFKNPIRSRNSDSFLHLYLRATSWRPNAGASSSTLYLWSFKLNSQIYVATKYNICFQAAFRTYDSHLKFVHLYNRLLQRKKWL